MAQVWTVVSAVVIAFSGNFLRQATFVWFCVTVVGLMVRREHLGVTSCIRALELEGKLYPAYIHLFRSFAWRLTSLSQKWVDIVAQNAPLLEYNGHVIALIDGCKGSKEGRFMPGTQKIRQDSETQTKAEYIFGNLFGALALVASRGGSMCNIVAVPVLISLQLGISHMLKWLDEKQELTANEVKKRDIVKRAIDDIGLTAETHAQQMFRNACITASILKKDMYLIGDRLFLSRYGLIVLAEYNTAHTNKIQFITRCRRSNVAYHMPPPKDPHKKGAPRKKGTPVKLGNQFTNKQLDWKKEKISMYGVEQNVTYAVLDLLWGPGLFQLLRFVLVQYADKKTILVSTDLELTGRQIIELYCLRARIETSFREFKQVIGGFAYHFWTRAMPKLNHFRKSSDPDPLDTVTSWDRRVRIVMTVRAIDFFALTACIALGIIQMISVTCDFSKDDFRWQRTPVNLDRPSEANVKDYLQRSIRQYLLESVQTELGQLIMKRLQPEKLERILSDLGSDIA